MTDERRWQVALHESSHIVVARKLSPWNCSCHASVLPSGGGLASFPAGLTDHQSAIATRASFYAEKLVRLWGPPCPVIGQESDPVDQYFTSKQCEMIHEHDRPVHRGFAKAGKTDLHMVLDHVADASDGTLKDIRQRLRRISASARLYVWKHRHEIREVAKKLYRDGAYYHAGNEDHNHHFTVTLTGDENTTNKGE